MTQQERKALSKKYMGVYQKARTRYEKLMDSMSQAEQRAFHKKNQAFYKRMAPEEEK
jgi:hypothetical protein